MNHFIVKSIPRAQSDLSISEELAAFGVATVAESQSKIGIMDDGLKPLQEGRSVAGPAVTVKCFDGDNLMVHAALEFCERGDIMVISSMTSTQHGYFGELLAMACKRREIGGVVIDGGIRDTQRIRSMSFPVWSRHRNAAGTSKNRPGWVNIPIVCGNVCVHPGDYIVADDDGVVVVNRNEVNTVISNCRARIKKEENTKERIERGELSVDFYGLKKVLDELGVKYLDRDEGGQRHVDKGRE